MSDVSERLERSDHIRQAVKMVSPMKFEIIKYNAVCWKVYLGNSYLGAHSTELQAANFVENLDCNIENLVRGRYSLMRNELAQTYERIAQLERGGEGAER